MSLHSVPVPEFLHPSSYIPMQINTHTLKEPYIYNLTQEIFFSSYIHTNQSTVSAAYSYIHSNIHILYKQMSLLQLQLHLHGYVTWGLIPHFIHHSIGVRYSRNQLYSVWSAPTPGTPTVDRCYHPYKVWISSTYSTALHYLQCTKCYQPYNVWSTSMSHTSLLITLPENQPYNVQDHRRTTYTYMYYHSSTHALQLFTHKRTSTQTDTYTCTSSDFTLRGCVEIQ